MGCTGSSLPESLQSLKQDAQSQWSWWSPSVIARTEMIERDSEDDWPAWLSDTYMERYHGAWDEALDAYYVMPRKHPRTGEAQPHENQREHWPSAWSRPMVAGWPIQLKRLRALLSRAATSPCTTRKLRLAQAGISVWDYSPNRRFVPMTLSVTSAFFSKAWNY